MICTEYEIERIEEICIAVVSDLHEHQPDEVLEILMKVQPDVIAVPGDLLERHEYGENLDKHDSSFVSRFLCSFIHFANKMIGLRWDEKHDVKLENSYEFLKEANKIAPVIMSMGNHELYLTDMDRRIIKETGTVLLDNSCVKIKCRDGSGTIIFAGIPSRQCTGEIDFSFLEAISTEPEYKVLLCHHPEYYDDIAQYVDLIISGHCHGGQIRIMKSGIFSPGQGLFPKYHHGIYQKPGMAKMVVSAGCSNTSSIPRIGNPCEVVLLNLGFKKGMQ